MELYASHDREGDGISQYICILHVQDIALTEGTRYLVGRIHIDYFVIKLLAPAAGERICRKLVELTFII